MGIRESFVGQQIVTSFFWGAIVTIFYAILLILLGRYPRLPVISDAARLQVMRGYLPEQVYMQAFSLHKLCKRVVKTRCAMNLACQFFGVSMSYGTDLSRIR